jgi:hypothetical protein
MKKIIFNFHDFSYLVLRGRVEDKSANVCSEISSSCITSLCFLAQPFQ